MKHAERRVIGRRIRELRSLRGLEKSDLARIMLVSIDRLTRIERGDVSPDLIEMQKICEHLDTEHMYILTGQFSQKLIGKRAIHLFEMFHELSLRDQNILLELAKSLTRDFNTTGYVEDIYKDGMKEMEKKLGKRIDNT